MAKFQVKPHAKPPEGALNLAERPENFVLEEARPVTDDKPRRMPEPDVMQEKRRPGRPSEGVKGFATRLSPHTITDIKALAEGLRLRSEGKAIERAVSFYKQHLMREVKAKLGDLGDEEELLRNAHKVD